jgi:putative membrane protein
MSKPNVADHQANERTFLAWLRTAIALMGFGFVVAKFGLFLRLMARAAPVPFPFSSGLIGIALVVVGGGMILMAAVRYRVLQRRIDDGSYEPHLLPMVVASGVLVVIAILLVAYLGKTAWS